MIKITDKYYLDADNTCFALKEKTKIADKKSKNFGEDDYITLGYYVHVEDALKGLTKYELRKFVGKQKIQEIDDLVKKIDELDKFFKEKIGKLK